MKAGDCRKLRSKIIEGHGRWLPGKVRSWVKVGTLFVGCSVVREVEEGGGTFTAKVLARNAVRKTQ